jgi:hypothetical protein
MVGTVMQIILQPVLFEPDKSILSMLEKALLKEFNVSSFIVNKNQSNPSSKNSCGQTNSQN